MKRIILLLFVLTLIINSSFLINNSICQWVQTSGPNGNSVICFTTSGNNLFGGNYYGGIYRTSNNGNNWMFLNSGLGSYEVRALASRNNYIFAGTPGGGIYRSTNNGANWINTNNGLTNTNIESLAINGINIFAGVSNGIFRSTNNGDSWVNMTNELSWVYTFLVKTPNVFAATNNGIFMSSNNGINWIDVTNDLPYRHIRFLASNGSTIFAGTVYEGIYRTTNNCANWNPVNTGLPNLQLTAMSSDGTNLFAGTYDGVYISRNNGNNWVKRNEGLPNNLIVFTFAVFNNYIFTSTNLQPVWRRSIPEIISTEITTISEIIPNKYELKQNYPNPFNPTTIIKFDLPKSSNVMITIYDLTGKTVEVLLNEPLKAGTYQIDWNGANYPSGVYFYNISMGNYTETKRMTLIK